MSQSKNIQQIDGLMQGYHESLQAAAEMLMLQQAARVLDFGIGTGAFAALFARAGAHIWGVDISEHMIDLCLAAHPDFTVVVGSFTPIPYEDAQFDTVVSSFALHEIMPISRGQACAELARVVRLGGSLCLLDIMFASRLARQTARRQQGRAWEGDDTYLLVGELDTLLREAGFGRLRWQQTSDYHWAVAGQRMI